MTDPGREGVARRPGAAGHAHGPPPGPTGGTAPFRTGPLDPAGFALLAGSHERLVGRPLVPQGEGSSWLFRDAPFGVLAHTGEDDPRFVYANAVALASFESTWEEFVGLPSRLSAEPDAREDRQRLLDAVERRGWVAGYRGRRISRTGRRFWIEDVTMWNLVDAEGACVGQAALFTGHRDA